MDLIANSTTSTKLNVVMIGDSITERWQGTGMARLKFPDFIPVYQDLFQSNNDASIQGLALGISGDRVRAKRYIQKTIWLIWSRSHQNRFIYMYILVSAIVVSIATWCITARVEIKSASMVVVDWYQWFDSGWLFAFGGTSGHFEYCERNLACQTKCDGCHEQYLATRGSKWWKTGRWFECWH